MDAEVPMPGSQYMPASTPEILLVSLSTADAPSQIAGELDEAATVGTETTTTVTVCVVVQTPSLPLTVYCWVLAGESTMVDPLPPGVHV